MLNKVTLIGNLGADPETRTFQNGGKVCNRCGTEFARPPRLSLAQWEKRRFCSRACGAQKAALTGDEIAKLYANGKSSTEVAELCGVSAAQVCRILRGMKVEIRGASESKALSHSRPDVRAKMSKSAMGKRHSEATKDRLRSVRGVQHPHWRNGMTVSAGGYLVFTESEGNGAHAGRYLHRVIAEWKEGRSLAPSEHVHHRDGDKQNNHPDNLQVMSSSDHARHHAIQNKLGHSRHA